MWFVRICGQRLGAAEDRQVDGVAGAADFRGFDGLAVLGDDAEGVVHRGLLGVLERAVELVRVADQEAAGEGASETFVVGVEELLALLDAAVLWFLGIAGGVGLAEDHVVARLAGDAVACQPAEMRLRRVGGVRNCIDHLTQEIGAGLAGFGHVDGELTLALDAVATEAGGLHGGEEAGWKDWVSLAS